VTAPVLPSLLAAAPPWISGGPAAAPGGDPVAVAPDFMEVLAAALGKQAPAEGEPEVPLPEPKRGTAEEEGSAGVPVALAAQFPLPAPPLAPGVSEEGADEAGLPGRAGAQTDPQRMLAVPARPAPETSGILDSDSSAPRELLPPSPPDPAALAAEGRRQELAFAARLTGFDSGAAASPYRTQPALEEALPPSPPNPTATPVEGRLDGPALAAGMAESRRPLPPHPAPSGAAPPADSASAARLATPVSSQTASEAPTPDGGAPAYGPPVGEPRKADATSLPAEPRITPGQRDPDEARTPAARQPAAGAAGPPEMGLALPAALSSGPMIVPNRHGASEARAACAAPQPEPPRAQPRDPVVRDISLAIPGTASDGRKPDQVSLRVVERTGEVRVAVHTSDTRLAGALREQLEDLVSQLADRGLRAETWQPLAGSSAAGGPAARAESAAADSGAGRDLPGNAGGGARDGGDQPAGQQQQQRRQGHDEPTWLQTLARSPGAAIRSVYDLAG
jgi:hypothetical protein